MSDSAHNATDKEIAALEKRIAKVYRQAYKETQSTVRNYFKKFEKRDAERRQQVENGSLSAEDYMQWRLTQYGRGERFASMRNQLAERYTNANEVAIDYVNGDLAKVYAMNRTYTIKNAKGATDYLKGVDFTLYDEATVKRLIKEQPDLMPNYPKWKAVNRGFDLEYGKRQITNIVTSGILQGKSIGKIANDLMDRINGMNRVSAIRAARTAMTEAENAGRQDGAEYLESLGCEIEKEWIATEDSRTRPAHAEANGQRVPLHDPFIVGGEELMHPGDQSLGASGWNIYNCRCTTGDMVTGFHSILPDELQGAVEVVD